MRKGAGRGRVADLRPHIGYVTAMTVFSAVFISLLLSAYHAPRPHGLPVGVVAPASAARRVAAGLEQAVPGGLAVRTNPDEAIT